MTKNNNSLLNSRRFLPLFSIMFLNATSDLMLKGAILVMLAFQGVSFMGLSESLAVNIFSLIFLLPFFIFSSYAGKLADNHNKVSIIKLVKSFELLIIAIAALGFYQGNSWLMLLALTAMGVHSTIFGPIKYSILPVYLTERKPLLLANGFIELGTFIATSMGQMLGSWYMGSYEIGIVVGILFTFAALGFILSFRLDDNLPITHHREKFEWNVFRDILLTYRLVVNSVEIRNNIHAISWFWAMGIIYTTQLPVFIKTYMGGGAHVYSAVLAIFSISIGLGSLSCAKLSNGKIHKAHVLVGAGTISVLSLILILINQNHQNITLELGPFLATTIGVINLFIIFLIGFFAGFYSVTCYNHIQVTVPVPNLARVVAVNNIMNAAYMLMASIICTLLLLFIDQWWLFAIFIVANCIFFLWYWFVNLGKISLLI